MEAGKLKQGKEQKGGMIAADAVDSKGVVVVLEEVAGNRQEGLVLVVPVVVDSTDEGVLLAAAAGVDNEEEAVDNMVVALPAVAVAAAAEGNKEEVAAEKEEYP